VLVASGAQSHKLKYPTAHNVIADFMFPALIFLHAGTSPVVSQTVLTLMFVVLGILIVGWGFGYVGKNKESLLQHRWMLTTVLVLTLIPVLLVMVPTMYRFYMDSDVQVFSAVSVMQMIHGAVSIPALATALVYAFGKLPGNVKKGMRWAAVLWVASLVLGVVLFLQMMDLLPLTPGM
jgi:uncharacterized membrane protein YozB (DUF420 family)